MRKYFAGSTNSSDYVAEVEIINLYGGDPGVYCIAHVYQYFFTAPTDNYSLVDHRMTREEMKRQTFATLKEARDHMIKKVSGEFQETIDRAAALTTKLVQLHSIEDESH